MSEETTEPRRYGKWAGNPRGYPERKAFCVEGIYPGRSMIQAQCTRRRGHGPDGEYCKQHATIHEIAERRKKDE